MMLTALLCLFIIPLFFVKPLYHSIYNGLNKKGSIFDAVTKGNLESVAYHTVLDKESINATDDFHRETALMLAASHGHLEIVKALIKAKANLETRNDLKDTILMYAAQGGGLETIKYLVEEKMVDVNAKNDYEETALKYARDAQYPGSDEVVQYLKKAMVAKRNRQEDLTPSAPPAHLVLGSGVNSEQRVPPHSDNPESPKSPRNN